MSTKNAANKYVVIYPYNKVTVSQSVRVSVP